MSGKERTEAANRHLGLTLAFVAGAVNAGGFLAVSQYTSHMTGVVSSLADNLALGQFAAVSAGTAALVSFLCGAATTALLVNWAARKRLRSRYALALMLEAALLLVFGFFGARLRSVQEFSASATVLLLCYIMGLQNAIITKVSDAVIRTTHVTGLMTDLGIELGKLVYWNADPSIHKTVEADRPKMALLSSLLGLFFSGGLVGAFGFKYAGFVAIIPLSALLFVIAIVPVWDDMTLPLED
ncbi:MAG: YoaK family protein [Elusimicrobiota bacterium]|nr:YoaK family protein [Elusimicrobiota bacterium]